MMTPKGNQSIIKHDTVSVSPPPSEYSTTVKQSPFIDQLNRQQIQLQAGLVELHKEQDQLNEQGRLLAEEKEQLDQKEKELKNLESEISQQELQISEISAINMETMEIDSQNKILLNTTSRLKDQYEQAQNRGLKMNNINLKRYRKISPL